MSSEMIEALVEERRRTGIGCIDECWEGVWHLTDPTATHQKIAGLVYRIFAEIIEDEKFGTAWISINITDREENWKKNHRCPDGAVILNGNGGRWIGESVAFLGGPDLILEVISEEEDAYSKFHFYGSLGVREILLIDQKTCEPELWRLKEGEYQRILQNPVSEVTGLAFHWKSEGLEIRHPSTGRIWKVH